MLHSLCSLVALRQNLAWRILDVQSIDILSARLINYIRQRAGMRFCLQPVFVLRGAGMRADGGSERSAGGMKGVLAKFSAEGETI